MEELILTLKAAPYVVVGVATAFWLYYLSQRNK